MEQKPVQKPNRLPVLRERLNELLGGMSSTEFAKKIGLSRQTVGFYLNGDRIPDSETLLQICEKCGVSADWLLGLTPEDTPDQTTRSVCEYTGLSAHAVDILHSQQNVYELGFIRRFIDSIVTSGNDDLWKVPELIHKAAQAAVIAEREQQAEFENDLRIKNVNLLCAVSKDGIGYRISAADAETYFLREAEAAIQRSIADTIGEFQAEMKEKIQASGGDFNMEDFRWNAADDGEVE